MKFAAEMQKLQEPRIANFLNAGMSQWLLHLQSYSEQIDCLENTGTLELVISTDPSAIHSSIIFSFGCPAVFLLLLCTHFQPPLPLSCVEVLNAGHRWSSGWKSSFARIREECCYCTIFNVIVVIIILIFPAAILLS